MQWGRSTLRAWSSAQPTIAMSSGEAELYAAVKGASYGKFLVSLAKDFGMELEVTIFTDSTAAIGIVHRSGLGGRTRHIQVQHLWLQEAISNGEMRVRKVSSEDNVADMLTKCICGELLQKHFVSMGFPHAALQS